MSLDSDMWLPETLNLLERYTLPCAQLGAGDSIGGDGDGSGGVEESYSVVSSHRNNSLNRCTVATQVELRSQLRGWS